MDYKILITTSGVGSRLWELTKTTNKALIQIWWKEIISHIIDSYPEDIEIIVTLWYFWNQVKVFLQKNYPNRNIFYINVDKFEWIGSSLWYSILQAKKELHTPFIFHCNDTIINSYIPEVKNNWAWWYGVTDSNQYATFSIDKNGITSFNTNKWAIDFDFAHVWVVWIYEYEKFFSTLENLYLKAPNNSNLNDVYVLDEMLKTWSEIKYIEFSDWLDTWNLISLEASKSRITTL